ncbi:sulfurtransferase [Neobacillus massiliamazoniensis]|uniref:Rhodanese domain-containing protein n=1 Tax=Neobacillus massiliamazoniensis TaxID=1499688 RepID=A0A0U1P0P4_9BACI|nr:sulfurtransferase [Neobacillus massiliamazoniensis]CRK83864.1 rhodanese domain-containing protein [Neobacillus massiliamazoniensis]
MKYVVKKEWLLKRLDDQQVRIVDCRFSLANPEKGGLEYREGHIPGAVYFDLEKDCSGTVGVHGGRHPMPDVDQFIEKLEKAGIDENTLVIAYDNGDGPYAARFWWLLRYFGHEKAYVLNGGIKEWVNASYPTTTKIPFFEKTKFNASIDSDLLATMEEVKEVVMQQQDHVILIDSREQKRYLGIEEPIDKKAGHIPGAVNKPWMEGLRDGHIKSAEEQMERFADIDREKQLIVYCGSGVTAVPNFLSLKEAGFEKVKLYVGSFSDWISYEDNEIE